MHAFPLIFQGLPAGIFYQYGIQEAGEPPEPRMNLFFLTVSTTKCLNLIGTFSNKFVVSAPELSG